VKVIVGLGNPGAKYRGTRHNIGFAVLDELARRAQVSFEAAPVEALIARWRERDALLAKPLTFMNRSGEAVAALARYYDIAPSELLVVVDEVALPFTRLRARAGGSAGGHNGLKSVIAGLGSTDFPRLRLGVGRGDARRDLADHVLAKFESGEKADLETFITRAADAAEMFAVADIGKVMNTYNPDPTEPDND